MDTNITATTDNSRPLSQFDGFVRAQDARLVDGRGNPLLLRGVGLGNWLLPEGYMWGFGPGAESPREIEALVARLIGQSAATSFWTRFRDQYITEHDIAAIAERGFDHVRLPINSRIVMDADGSLIESGFAIIDRTIEWCRDHGLWLLLDLHGAPGGQTGTNIDDSPGGKPELFMEKRYRDQTLHLWRAIAERYASETVVLGYDLLNEPLPDEWQYTYADELVRLYRDLTAVIREVDPDHLIVYEGSHWATNWDIFTEVLDDNSLLQFHKYWSPPDTASIRKYLDVRERLGLPIYMGEGGENNLEWLYAAFRLYEAHEIGWNLWPWKKIETLTSPLSVRAPDGWADVRAAVNGESQPSQARATEIFGALLEALAPSLCVAREDVVAAVFGRSPAVIPAWGFGFRGRGESYETSQGVPPGAIRLSDEASIKFANPGDNPSNPFEQHDGRAYLPKELLCVHLEAGDWLEYEVEGEAGSYTAMGRDGSVSSVDVVRSERGLRAVARTAVDLVSLVR